MNMAMKSGDLLAETSDVIWWRVVTGDKVGLSLPFA